MACYRAEEFGDWCESEGTVYKDASGKEYCLFHAPVNQKGMSVVDFNRRVFNRIRNNPAEYECDLRNTIFPGDIDFSAFDKNSPLPPITLMWSEFTGFALFDKAVFSDTADFRAARFHHGASFVDAWFEKDAVFDGAQFHKHASFKDCAFSQQANFGASEFGENAQFSKAIFHGEAFFNGAKFKEAADFTEGAFKDDFDLSDSTITGMADFRSREFSKKLNFKGSIFRGSAHFSGLKFIEDIDFRDARFEGAISFRKTDFGQNADFHAARFIGESDFQWARFVGLANFRYTFFEQDAPDQHADFQEAEFSRGVDFSGSRFHISTVFYRAKFADLSWFNGTVFGRKVSFQEAHITSPIEFLTTVFTKDVTFMRAHFSDEAEARFDGAIFQKRADFSETEFQNNVTFYPYPPIHLSGFGRDSSPIVAQFCGKADFFRTSFRAKCYFKQTVFKKTARFEDLTIDKRVRFEEVDLSYVSLIDVELDNIQFVDATWPRRNGKNHNRYQLIEEKSSKSSFWKIEAYYRRLKKRAKEEHNQSDLSEWHYCEKQIALKRAWHEWRRFLGYLLFLGWVRSKDEKPQKAGSWALPILCLYWGSSGYGERPLRAAIVLTGLILSITLMMGLYGLSSVTPGEEMLLGFNHFWLLLYNTIENALFFKQTLYKPIIPIPDGLMQTLFTRILIPIQFALFALALRNKFRR